MGRWSQAKLRGGGGVQETAKPAGPELAFVAPSNLSWTWSSGDPDFWEIETSNDGVSGWANVDEEPGAARAAIAVTILGQFYRIWGSTNGTDQTTGISNVVEATL